MAKLTGLIRTRMRVTLLSTMLVGATLGTAMQPATANAVLRSAGHISAHAPVPAAQLGPRVTYLVPPELDPNGEFLPPAAVVSMRLPEGVTFDQLSFYLQRTEVSRPGKPVVIHLLPDFYGSDWFEGPGWNSPSGFPPTRAETFNGAGTPWSFGWTSSPATCDGTRFNVEPGVVLCETYYTILFSGGGGGKSTTEKSVHSVLRLWKRVADGGYLYLSVELGWRGTIPTTATALANGFHRPVFRDALAIIESANTLAHNKPLTWPAAPTPPSQKCLGTPTPQNCSP